MIVRDLMQRNVVTIPVGTPWRRVVELLLLHHITGAPVVDASGTVVGVVSEKDVFRAIYPSYEEWYAGPQAYTDLLAFEEEARAAQGKTVEQFMSTRVKSVPSDTPVLKIGALMVATGIHRVPVVDRGKLVGMVSRHTIFRTILRVHFGLEETQRDHEQAHVG
ncbi:MAG: CBS domain-containing protein [bacterium]|nr:CBS domain-containing protein [bacterium]